MISHILKVNAWLSVFIYKDQWIWTVNKYNYGISNVKHQILCLLVRMFGRVSHTNTLLNTYTAGHVTNNRLSAIINTGTVDIILSGL